MLQIKEERRRHILLFEKRLEEFCNERQNLVSQLEVLDTNASSIERQRNELLNLDALTSNLPDEALAMIFEAGMEPDFSPFHFGDLVSHVSRRWRDIALATPALWANHLFFRAHVYGKLRSWDETTVLQARKRMVESATVFLSRSRTFPVNIHISALYKADFTPDLLRVLSEHMGHCRRLVIEGVDQESLPMLLEYLQWQSVPLLTTFAFTVADFAKGVNQQGHVFSSGAPHLKTVLLGYLEYQYSLGWFIPTLASVTSLSLQKVTLKSLEVYEVFRHALMDLKALSHLELAVTGLKEDIFRVSTPSITLPTLKFLKVCAGINANPFVAEFVKSIHAASLTSLSLEGWPKFNRQNEESGPLTHQFPSLHHLTLTESGARGIPLKDLAERFPDIEHLTCHGICSYDSYNSCGMEDIIKGILWGNTELAEGEDGSAPERPRWLKLHTVATSSPCSRTENASSLIDNITTLQEFGCPIARLVLPAHRWTAGLVVKLKEVIDVQEYCDDWPTPFRR